MTYQLTRVDTKPSLSDLTARRVGVLLGILTFLQTGTQLRNPGSTSFVEAVAVLLLTWIVIRGRVVMSQVSLISKLVGCLLLFTLGSLGLTAWFGQGDPISFLLALALLLILLFVLAAEASGSPVQTVRSWASTFGVLTLAAYTLLYLIPEAWIAALGLSTGSLSSRFLGWSSNPNQAAAFLMIAVGCLLVVKPPTFPGSRAVALTIGVPLILATDSDSARIALVFASMLSGVFVAVRLGWGLRVPWVLTLAASILLFWVPISSWLTYQSIDSLREEGDQLGSRSAIWGACWDTALEHPILGRGFGSVRVPGLSRRLECHNALLDIGVAAGLLALVTTLIVLAFILYRLLKAKNLVATTAFLALMVMQVGNSAIRFPAFWLFLLLLWHVPSSMSQATREPPHEDVLEPDLPSEVPHASSSCQMPGGTSTYFNTRVFQLLTLRRNPR